MNLKSSMKQGSREWGGASNNDKLKQKNNTQKSYVLEANY
jgi:hypothetical protein